MIDCQLDTSLPVMKIYMHNTFYDIVDIQIANYSSRVYSTLDLFPLRIEFCHHHYYSYMIQISIRN